MPPQDVSKISTEPNDFSEDTTDWSCIDVEPISTDDLLPISCAPVLTKSTSEVKCNGCDLLFYTSQELKDHLSKTKCGSVYAQCPDCPKVFDSAMKLTRHRVVHKKENAPRFECNQCLKRFLSDRILNSHLAKVHGIHIQRKFQCLKCPKSFNFENQLRCHEEKHKNKQKDPDLFCDQCDMICANRSALHYHLQKHNNPLHQCPKCPKSFKSEFGLDYHLKIHNNEKNHLCPDCGKGFISPYKLIHHKRSAHTLEKPFVCEQCGEGFIRNDKLTVHKRRAHTGEKPYACNICPWRGVDSSSLIHHKKKHTKQLQSTPKEVPSNTQQQQPIL